MVSTKMNSDLNTLQPYPFEKLKALKAQVNPPEGLAHIALSIGEPKHTPPEFVLESLKANLDKIAVYPTTKGLPELREAISVWASKRFHLQADSLSPENNVLPVCGTREALFAFTQAIIDRERSPLVISPNPFYQIYEGAALLAGAELLYLNCDKDNQYLPNFDAVSDEEWQRCQLVFLCTPGNPTGAVASLEQLKQLIQLADKHDFTIVSDECYSELYFDEANPPPGLLQACAELGRHDFARCAVFHSLSKRSNLPGLRSGFVAGDGRIMEKFLLYRTYHGCAMPVATQIASIAAWQDESHVKANRDLYREKFAAVLEILDGCLEVSKPDASFYLWPQTPIADTDFAQQLFAQENITVLPGRYIARDTPDGNAGLNYVRLALVAPLAQCIEAAHRIKRFVDSL